MCTCWSVARTDAAVGTYSRVTMKIEGGRGGPDVHDARVTLGSAGVADELTVQCEVHGEAVVLRLDGDIDMVTAPVVNKSIKAALAQSPSVLVVELSGVEFMASAGLAELATGHHLAGKRTAFRVVAPRRATSRPLELVGLTEVFGVFATLEDALETPAGA